MNAGCDDYVMRDQRYPDPSGEAVERRVVDAIERMVSLDARYLELAERHRELNEREDRLAVEREQRGWDLCLNATWTLCLMTWTVYLLSGGVGFLVGLLVATAFAVRYWERLSMLFDRRGDGGER